MNIADKHVVSIHYTLTNDAGDVLDTSEGKEPLTYLHGSGNIIPGLERALTDKTAGEELNVTVEPNDGYGEHREELIQKVPREAFQGVEQLDVGMRFQAQTQNGPVMVVITEVGETEVTVEGNHELAGQRLHFAVKIEDVRAANQEELDHGHVH